MALYINGNKTGGGNANVIRLTQAEYDALPPSKLTDNNIYMITDANGDGSQFQPVIYSENEREIGIWTDGKPLYEITIDCGELPNNTSKNITTPTNIEHLIDAFGCVTDYEGNDRVIPFAGGGSNDIRVDLSDGNLRIVTFAAWVGYYAFVTVRYTKTTDTAGSGTWTPQGVPAVHYSTDEQVVGTWVDGSTLYEKTYSVNFTYGSLTCDVAFSDISNLNSIIDLKGIFANAVPFTLNGVINNSNKLIITSLHQYEEYGYIGPEGIRVKRGDILWYGDTPSVIVTIRYTKSTI